MPERLANWWTQLTEAFGFFAFGILLTIGQVLSRKEKTPWRIIIGRSISNGGLASAAGVVLLWYPEAPLIVLIGVAASLATLGTAGLERLFQRVIQGQKR